MDKFFWLEQSRGQWYSEEKPTDTAKYIAVGCLQRIANALETIAHSIRERDERRKKAANERWRKEMDARIEEKTRRAKEHAGAIKDSFSAIGVTLVEADDAPWWSLFSIGPDSVPDTRTRTALSYVLTGFCDLAAKGEVSTIPRTLSDWDKFPLQVLRHVGKIKEDRVRDWISRLP